MFLQIVWQITPKTVQMDEPAPVIILLAARLSSKTAPFSELLVALNETFGLRHIGECGPQAQQPGVVLVVLTCSHFFMPRAGTITCATAEHRTDIVEEMRPDQTPQRSIAINRLIRSVRRFGRVTNGERG